MKPLASLPDGTLQTVYMMIEPPKDWLTKPLTVAADGNPQMLKAVKQQKTQPARAGSIVIRELARLYQRLGRTVALFESSQAAQRVTERVIGSPDPDDVFTVDYVNGYRLKDSRHLPGMLGTLVRPDVGNYVNLVNRLTVPTRWLELFVMQIICERLGVKNVLTQPEGTWLEGGDMGFLPTCEGVETLFVTGDGPNSRSNKEGRDWLYRLLQPDHRIDIISSEFHRDLVSVLVQGKRGELVEALLASNCITNTREVEQRFSGLSVPVIRVPDQAVRSCALNLSVSPGLLIGMQTDSQFKAALDSRLTARVHYMTLPDHLQEMTAGFIDMQGGANCVSGNVLVRPGDIDLSRGHIADINVYLHSRQCEDYLESVALQLQMREAVAESRARQRKL
ncbi:MAG: hypothetical protein V1908_00915 [Candidatus Peregrinibacteria bacterium]